MRQRGWEGWRDERREERRRSGREERGKARRRGREERGKETEDGGERKPNFSKVAKKDLISQEFA